MEEAIAKLASNQLHVTTKLDELIQRITVLETSQQHSPTPSSSSANPHSLHTTPILPSMKLEVPRFDGSDPSGWTFKIRQFFEYHATLEPERLVIASFAMEGLALAWFQWLTRNGQISSWTSLLHALED